MDNDRTKNSIRNYSMNAVSQVTSILLSFIGRTFFIKFLGIEYLGVNGLFSNILSLLSLAELGVGTAITYMMYRPIAEGNKEEVAAYNNLFRQIYNSIGVFVLVVGLFFTPFVYDLIKEKPDINENLYIVYILYLLNSSVSYFFTYKRSLLIAHQKEYVNSKNVVMFAIVKDVLLILLLYIYANFYVYLVLQIIITVASNFAISLKVNSLFPDIVNIKPKKVPRKEIRIIVKNTMAMICHKIGSVVVSGTGNIFISYFVGIATVGIYSNYVLLSNCSRQIIGQGINSLTASFGNLVATSNNEDIYRVYKRIYFINFLLAYAVALFFLALVNPFVTLWIGGDFILEKKCILVIAVNALFFYQLRIPSQIVINTYGLFWQIKWKSIVEALVNLLCSLFLTAWLGLGIWGILLAALISNVCTSLWWEPYVAFRKGMKISFKLFVFEFLKNCIIFAISVVLLYLSIEVLLDMCNISIAIQILLNTVLCMIIIILMVVVFYSSTAEFEYVLKLLHIKKD